MKAVRKSGGGKIRGAHDVIVVGAQAISSDIQTCVLQQLDSLSPIATHAASSISRIPQSTAAKMSTLEDLDAMEHQDKKEGDEKRDGDEQDPKKPGQGGDADMKDADGDKKDEDEEEVLDSDILNSSTRDIVTRRRLLENDTRIMRSEFQRLTHEKQAMLEKIKDNVDKIDNNRCAPFKTLLVPNKHTDRKPVNSPTSLEMSSKSSTSMSRQRRPKRAPTSISTQLAWASRPLSRHLPARPSSCP